MKRETKINMLVAALANLIAQGKKRHRQAPQIVFLSKTEVRFDKFPRQQLPINKVLNDNPLFSLLQQVIDYYIDDEYRHYLECLYEEDEEAAETFEKEGIYNSDALPAGHIYDILYACQELIKEPE